MDTVTAGVTQTWWSGGRPYKGWQRRVWSLCLYFWRNFSARSAASGMSGWLATALFTTCSEKHSSVWSTTSGFERLHLKDLVIRSYPVQGLFEAVQPVVAGLGVLRQVDRVGDVRGRVLQQGQINQLPLQTVHLQHVKLDTTNTRGYSHSNTASVSLVFTSYGT